MTLLRPNPERPSGPAAVNRLHPSANSLTSLFVGSDPSLSLRDSVTNQKYDTVNSAAISQASSVSDSTTGGRVLTWDGTSPGIIFAANTYTQKPSKQITVVMRCNVTNVPGGFVSVNYGTQWEFISDTGSTLYGQIYITGGTAGTGVITQDFGSWRTLVLRWMSGDYVRFSKWSDDGIVLSQSLSSDLPVDTLVNNYSTSLTFGDRSALIVDFVGQWSRWLPDDEVSSLIRTRNTLLARPQRVWALGSSVATNVSITGVSSSGSTSSAAPNPAAVDSGSSATGSSGTIAATTSPGLSGTTSSASPGSVTPNPEGVNTGVSGTASVGTAQVLIGQQFGPTGVSATSSVGAETLAIGSAVSLTGTSSTASTGLQFGPTLFLGALSSAAFPGVVAPSVGAETVVFLAPLIAQTQLGNLGGFPKNPLLVPTTTSTAVAVPGKVAVSIGTTSGQYGYDPQGDEIILEAFERCGLSTSEVTSTDVSAAITFINLIFAEWCNRGLLLFEVDEVSVPFTYGMTSFALPVGTIDVLEMILRQQDPAQPDQPIDAPLLTRINLGEYMQLPDKLSPGIPIMYYVDRQFTPTVYVYQTPIQNQAYTLIAKCWKQIFDYTAANQTPGVPYRWLAPLVAGLASYVCLYKNKPELYPELRSEHERTWMAAMTSERDSADFSIRTDIGYYNRW